MPIIANLILGRDGGTTVGGRSAPLSSALDRQRFHELRAMADAIVIGGQTARIEPYGKTPVPLIVVTKSAQLPALVRSNPFLQISNQGIPETLRSASLQFNTLLIEAGATFVADALAEKLIDDLYITQVQTPAAAPYFNYSSLGSDFTLVQSEGFGGEEFLHYARLPQNGGV
jgi:riboflavin biosynthesis pyrimidine reductase